MTTFREVGVAGAVLVAVALVLVGAGVSVVEPVEVGLDVAATCVGAGPLGRVSCQTASAIASTTTTPTPTRIAATRDRRGSSSTYSGAA